MTTADMLKVALLFLNAFAGFLAAAPGTDIDPAARLVAAALVAGCGAALLYLNPPGKKVNPDRLTAAQTKQVADELERRMKATPQNGGT